MIWPLLMLLHNLFASLYMLLSRVLAKKYQAAHFQAMAVVFGITFVIFLTYGLAHVNELSVSLAVQYLPLMLLAGTTIGLSGVLSFITFRYVDASIGSLFSSLNILGIVAVASLLIGESLTYIQMVGAALLMVAILVILTIHLPRLSQHRWFVGLGLTVLSSVMLGVGIATEKYLLDHIGMPTYSVFGVGLQFLVLLAVALIYKPKQFELFKKDRWFTKRVLLLGVVRGIGGMLFVVAMVMADNASLVGVLSGLKIILTAILAALFLKEVAFMKRKVVAALLAFAGIGIMLW